MLRHNGLDIMNITNNKAHNSNLSNINGCGSSSGSPMDALPKQFVSSMKTLFDILDDQHTGFVKFVDIEKGWQDDGCKGLPHGVIDSLRKVTPASGLLSFDRFCAGLKLCLLRNQSTTTNMGVSPMKPPRPPSAPLLDIDSPLPGSTTWTSSNNTTNATTATVRPHKIAHAHRALSLPQLSPDSELEAEMVANDVGVYNSPPPPPKPPRASAASQMSGGVANTPTTPIDKAEIRHALQNWQMGILLNEMGTKDKHISTYNIYNQYPYRGCADGGSSSATDSITGGTAVAVHSKKGSSKRREPRRHTLQNGIDYNMLKRLKQFEEEREVLLTGLDAVDKARDWYLQQIANVQEKIKYLGRMGHVEQWSEVQQERLEFQRARVYEVNRNLAALADCWERGGFPLHFNLAIRTPGKALSQRNSGSGSSSNGGGLLQPVDRLRQQNHNLSNEVNLKSDRIALLEREKQSLMRELYELRQRVGIVGRNPGFVTVLGQSSPSSSGGLGEADVVF